MQVLVVDDEFIIATDTAETLIEAGHDVAGPVGTVEEAVQICEHNRPDLALIDVNLHGRQEGPALARVLQRFGIPCLFVTAQPALAREHKGAAVGVLSKPFAGRDLVASVPVAHAAAHGVDEPRSWRPRNLELFTPDEQAGDDSDLAPARATA
jgi:CheY-like chemotaxis protein